MIPGECLHPFVEGAIITLWSWSASVAAASSRLQFYVSPHHNNNDNMLSLRVAATLIGVVYAQYDSSLPTVDLGYEIHRASNFNVRASLRFPSTAFLNFS